jgi:hypothetical protein
VLKIAGNIWARTGQTYPMNGLSSYGTAYTPSARSFSTSILKKSITMKLSIEKLREVSPKLKDLPDEVVEKIRDDMDKLADVLFDMWLEKKNKGKQNDVV